MLESLPPPLDWMLVSLKLPPAICYCQVTLLFPALSGENYYQSDLSYTRRKHSDLWPRAKSFFSMLPVCTSTVLISIFFLLFHHKLAMCIIFLAVILCVFSKIGVKTSHNSLCSYRHAHTFTLLNLTI